MKHGRCESGGLAALKDATERMEELASCDCAKRRCNPRTCLCVCHPSPAPAPAGGYGALSTSALYFCLIASWML